MKTNDINEPVIFSRHAEERSRENGFNKELIVFYMLFGERYIDNHGNIALVVSREKISEIEEKIAACSCFTLHLTREFRIRGAEKGRLVTTVIKKDHPSQNWKKICA